MFKRILGSFSDSRRRNSRTAARNNVGGYRRRLRHEHLEGRHMLATLTVSVNSDGSILPNDGNLTLREAIAYVNRDAEPLAGDLTHITGTFGQNDMINFSTDPADGLNGGRILLDDFLGQLTITESVTIDATMLPQGITLDAIETEIDPTVPGGQDGLRVFDLGGPETFTLNVTLAGLTMTGGDLRSYGGSLCGPFGLAA